MINTRTRIYALPLLAAPVLFALVLTSCGGGGSNGSPSTASDQKEMTITPTQKLYYGAYDWGTLGPNCSDGWAIGVATGYSNASAAAAAAMNECETGGGRDCGPDVGAFGSAYPSDCVAIWFGEDKDQCQIGARHGADLLTATNAARTECRTKFGRIAGCPIIVQECSPSGPAKSYSRTTAQSSDPDTTDTTKPKYYSTVRFTDVWTQPPRRCPARLLTGVSTGHLTPQAAEAAARARCREVSDKITYPNNRDTICLGVGDFGSARGYTCGAIAYGENGEACAQEFGDGNSKAEAELFALTNCEKALGGGFFGRAPDGRVVLDPPRSNLCRVRESFCGP